MNRIRVAVNGYGVIGKRVADAVRLQEDMTLAGVADIVDDYRLQVAARAAHRNFKRPLACLWPLESPTDAWVAGRYRPGWLGTDGCDIVLS